MEATKNSDTRPKEQRSTSLGVFFPAFVIIQWVFTLIKEWGYVPYQGWGIALSFGMYIIFMAIVFSADYALSRAGIRRPVRSGIWAGSFLGPYLGLYVFNTWGHPVWSQMAGAAGTILAFVFTYLIDKRRYGE